MGAEKGNVHVQPRLINSRFEGRFTVDPDLELDDPGGRFGGGGGGADVAGYGRGVGVDFVGDNEITGSTPAIWSASNIIVNGTIERNYSGAGGTITDQFASAADLVTTVEGLGYDFTVNPVWTGIVSVTAIGDDPAAVSFGFGDIDLPVNSRTQIGYALIKDGSIVGDPGGNPQVFGRVTDSQPLLSDGSASPHMAVHGSQTSVGTVDTGETWEPDTAVSGFHVRNDALAVTDTTPTAADIIRRLRVRGLTEVGGEKFFVALRNDGAAAWTINGGVGVTFDNGLASIQIPAGEVRLLVGIVTNDDPVSGLVSYLVR